MEDHGVPRDLQFFGYFFLDRCPKQHDLWLKLFQCVRVHIDKPLHMRDLLGLLGVVTKLVGADDFLLCSKRKEDFRCRRRKACDTHFYGKTAHYHIHFLATKSGRVFSTLTMANSEALNLSSWFGDHVIAVKTNIVVCGSSDNARSGSWTSHGEQRQTLQPGDTINVLTVNSLYAFIGLQNGRGIMIERHAINDILVRKNTPSPSPIATEASLPSPSTPEAVSQ